MQMLPTIYHLKSITDSPFALVCTAAWRRRCHITRGVAIGLLRTHFEYGGGGAKLCDQVFSSSFDTHTHAHARKHMHTHTQAHACTCTHARARIMHAHARTVHANAHTCMRTHARTHAHILMCTQLRLHTIHTHVHKPSHIFIHTHTSTIYNRTYTQYFHTIVTLTFNI